MSGPTIHFMTLNEIVLATEHERKHYRDREVSLISTEKGQKVYGVLSITDLGDDGVEMIIAEKPNR